MAILEIKNLSFNYPTCKQRAVNNVSLKIKEGSFVVLCGTTGSGKTTLLKLIKREISPFGEMNGEVLYEEKPLGDISDLRAASEIGYVMQKPENQIVCDKVWHELAFGLENLGVSTEVIRRRVGEMASFFGINDWFRKDTYILSGGEKQLLNLASIMVMQPKILLLDEPTSQLDPIAATEFIRTLQKLNQELGLTIILVEHRLQEVFPIADQVIVMDQGSIIADGNPRSVGSSMNHDNITIGLPSAVRIFKALNINTQCPLTVREGKDFLSNHFSNTIKNLDKKREVMNLQDYAIELKNVWFRYEKNLDDVLRGVNIKIRQGEIFSLVGGNGSGKSTLLKIISGIKKPYIGKVIINQKNIKDYKDNSLYLNNLSMLPQNPQDIFLESVVRLDLEEIAKLRKFDKVEFKKHFDEVVERLELHDILDKHPYDLSGGEQQKVGLAKVLLLKPKIVLLDEPTKGLDADLKQKLNDILIELKKSNICVLIVTHDIEFAARVSDYCGMIFDGEIISVDKPNDFFAGNNFYTTAANRISRHMYDRTITEEDVIKLALLNGELCEK